MQPMPQTAQLMAGKTKVRADELLEPKLNVSLGQRYLAHLLEHETVQGDLIRLAAAYNGGPGNLQRWKRKQDLRGTAVHREPAGARDAAFHHPHPL